MGQHMHSSLDNTLEYIIHNMATLNSMHHHILNTPNLVSEMGAFSEALTAMLST